MKHTFLKSGYNSIKSVLRVAVLAAAGLLIAGSVSAYNIFYNTKSNNRSWQSNDFLWYGDLTAVNDVVTFTVNARAMENYFYFSRSGSVDDIVNMNSFTYQDPQGLLDDNEGAHKADYSQKVGVFFYTKAAGEITIQLNVNTQVCIFSSSVTQYTVSTSITYGYASPATVAVNEGSSVDITVHPNGGRKVSDNYSITAGTGTVTRNGNVFTVTPTANTTLSVVCEGLTYSMDVVATPQGAGTVSPTSATDITYDGWREFTVTPASGFSIDKTNTTYTGIGSITYPNATTIRVEYICSSGVLTVAFKSDTDITPIVHFGDLPQQVGNSVNVGAYLAERYCQTVTASGFFWDTKVDVSTSDNTKKISATANPVENGDEFFGTYADLSSALQSGQNVFFKAFVTTAGGTGYSDVVGIFYNPCYGIASVEIEPSEYALTPGNSKTLSVLTRGAGKSPLYVWEDNDVVIENASFETLNYTMPADGETHVIKVTVSESTCSSEMSATATLTPESAFDFEWAADKTTTTPWDVVTLTVVTDDTFDSFEVASVPDGAEIVSIGNNQYEFRAPVLSGNQTIYTITGTAILDSAYPENKVVKSIDITVVKDEETCDNN